MNIYYDLQRRLCRLSNDEEHSAIGEQCGILKKWVVEDIGENEILQLCFEHGE